MRKHRINSNLSLQKVKSQDNGNGAKENGKGRNEKQKTELEGVKRDITVKSQ